MTQRQVSLCNARREPPACLLRDSG